MGSRALDRRGFIALVRAAASRRFVTAPRDHALIYLMGKTGLRISEALSLRVHDLWLDVSPPFLRVRTLKQRRPRVHEVLLEAHLVRLLRFYVARRLPAMLHRAALPEDHLFPALRCARPDKPMTRRNAAGMFRIYVRLAGLPPGVVLHSLRHFRGTTLLRVTGDREFTREQMRHSSLQAVEDYVHTDPELAKGYIDRLEGDL